MNSKTKSIILQVAFKEAAPIIEGEGLAETKALTQEFYNILISLHTELGIEPDNDAPRGSGGGSYNAQRSLARMETPTSAVAFTDTTGIQWLDYRVSKTNGEVKPRFPDFKTADGKVSVYEFGLNGSPNPQFTELATASDGLTSLTDPFIDRP